jgi:dephospho-CoA kinase
MVKVGLTGGYATGKSFVAAELERLGCHLIYADRLGHAVLERGGGAYQQTVEFFGSEILTSDGAINRKRLGEIVFASADLLETLNGFVHPAVFRMEEELLKKFAAEDPDGFAVIEAAILIETNRFRVFDRLILTVCKESTQIARGMTRDHLTEAQVRARLSKQMSSEEKVRYADYVIDTDRPKTETIINVRKIHRDLLEVPARSSA